MKGKTAERGETNRNTPPGDEADGARLRRFLSPSAGREIAHERIYSALKSALMAGEFSPGDKMTVRGLAEAFGTSPMPIREALRRLVTDRALAQQANRGTVVPPLSLEHILDLRRIRMYIEGLAAELAAATIQDEELDMVIDLQRRMRGMVETGDSAEYLATNRTFHFTIYNASRSDVLIPVIESLWLQAGPYLTTMRQASTLGMGLEHHDQAIDALRRGDGPAARRAIAEDIADAADVMIRTSAGYKTRQSPPRPSKLIGKPVKQKSISRPL